MSRVSHQTIKLSKGKHRAPEDGACVMELASMLAGEPFTDRPECVCPAIGSFLRAYNDSIDDRRRQDLYACAARVVGSRDDHSVEQARAERLIDWACDVHPPRAARMLPPRVRAFAGRRRPPIDAAGTYAVHAIRRHTDETHAAVLALLDDLLAIGTPRADSATPPRSPAPDLRPVA